ncbi:MAG: 6-carboxyhexanoate--CoA ligase [Kiritimatiellae bacterium]|nr:6-carboxyhexanoate--CoA ligase [Kiritimatiellia bacterium]
MTETEPLFCVKMRAAAGGAHVSGAERIVPAAEVPGVLAALGARAMEHPKGRPDEINLRVEPAGDILHVPALPVFSEPAATAAEGLARAAELLAADGVRRVPEIMALFRETCAMRGAMLLDADTLERLEPDRERGVRATRMDAAREPCAAAAAPGDSGPCAASAAPGGSGALPRPLAKDHFSEALVLASKVQAAPGIVAEICVSDDPDYVTGYVASKTLGYRRIATVKERGDPAGGRIFLFRGPRALVPGCIRFLQERAVLVDGVPAAPWTPSP